MSATVTLTASMQRDKFEEAVRVLRAYYAPLRDGFGFTGGAWDTFDPSGTRALSTNTFTADDLAACALLATPIHGRATLELLQRQRPKFEKLLEEVGPDRDFVTVKSADGEDFRAVRHTYAALRNVPGIGETRATKLLARKRPRLVPIVDSVIRQSAFNNATRHWSPLHEALVADGNALWKRLVHLRDQAGLGPEVSVLRVFDVLAWMDGSGNSELVLREMPIGVQTEEGKPGDDD